MAQVLKDEVQQRICDAALQAFAQQGYRTATMGEIAAAAGISTGNIYRYFDNKEELFQAVIPPTFAKQLAAMVRRRVKALTGVADISTLPASAPYHVVSEELLRFCCANRLRVVALLGKAEGTPYESFAAELVAELARLASAHARSTHSPLPSTETVRFVLGQIYIGLVRTLANILTEFAEEPEIRAAVSHWSNYHLAGLRGFFDQPPFSAARSAQDEQ